MALREAHRAHAAGAARKVHVGLGERAYDILIGSRLIEGAGALIAAVAPGSRCAVVTDETVAALHLASLQESLGDALAGACAVPAGESSKSFAALEPLCESLLQLGIERGDSVIAFGGGVVGDLGGFAAGILRRGVRLIQIPTTLLAQVDSSVGGKTGINSSHGKNLIGLFHQPSLVVADTRLLGTLPRRQLLAGYAEVVKYGLLGDAAFFSWLDRDWRQVLEEDGEARAHAVETCCRAKAEIVAEDERELGRRALLNLGHTFGHALEAFAGFSDRLLHGEAVAIGMAMAFAFSSELDLCPSQERDRAIAHLRAVGLPTRVVDIPGSRPTPAALLASMAQDKKVRRGKPAFILVRGIGQAYIEHDVPMDRLTDFLARHCDASRDA